MCTQRAGVPKQSSRTSALTFTGSCSCAGKMSKPTDRTNDCKKIPYFCVSCQRQVNFFAATNDFKLVKHEESERHRAGLICLPPPQPAAEDGPGDEPRKSSGLSFWEPNTPISKLAESMRTFILARCPGIVFQKDVYGQVAVAGPLRRQSQGAAAATA